METSLPVQALSLLCYQEVLALFLYFLSAKSHMGEANLPKSLMLYTPVALELALLCPFFSSVGETPATAESTFVRLFSPSVDMIGERMQESKA